MALLNKRIIRIAIGITIGAVCSFTLSPVVGFVISAAWTVGSEFV